MKGLTAKCNKDYTLRQFVNHCQANHRLLNLGRQTLVSIEFLSTFPVQTCTIQDWTNKCLEITSPGTSPVLNS